MKMRSQHAGAPRRQGFAGAVTAFGVSWILAAFFYGPGNGHYPQGRLAAQAFSSLNLSCRAADFQPGN